MTALKFINSSKIKPFANNWLIRCSRTFSVSNSLSDKYKCETLVIGGGTGGCAIAAKLSSQRAKDGCIVLEPASEHYYQPMFTMIGGGMKCLSQSRQSMESVLPKKAKWIKDSAMQLNPHANEVITELGHTINYDIVVIAVGLQLNYDKVPGLKEALSVRNGNVTSIYSPEYVERHLNAMWHFESGNIIFTFPASPVKCPGAPQKICYITEHFLRRIKKRQNANIFYNTALPVIFGVKYFADALWIVAKQRNVNVNLKTNLVEVHGKKNQAVFANVDNPSERTTVDVGESFLSSEYSILHAVPPQSVPKVLLESKLLTNESGFVDVDKGTLQHVKYPNVFALGDCASTPNSKTMAAIASQVGVLYKNIQSFKKGYKLSSLYDGYASCPLVTGYNSCIMAEFDYNFQPKETFPFRQDCERYSMFLLKRDIMPILYWKLMLNGYWNGPEPYRKLFSIFKRS